MADSNHQIPTSVGFCPTCQAWVEVRRTADGADTLCTRCGTNFTVDRISRWQYMLHMANGTLIGLLLLAMLSAAAIAVISIMSAFSNGSPAK